MLPYTPNTEEYFKGSDIFLMLSKGDPFPCVVHEAMASNLMILGFKSSGGFVEMIDDESGIALEYGNTYALVDVILDYRISPERYSKYPKNALLRVKSVFKFDDYVEDVFMTLISNSKSITDKRELFKHPELSSASTIEKPIVIFTLPDWWISGVNTFIEILIRGLIEKGYDAFILFTTTNPLYSDDKLLPSVPYQFLSYSHSEASNEGIWKNLHKYLERLSPCVFVPNYDYVSSAISSSLSSNVGILGVLHSDDIEHYEHAYRLGLYWNQIVCVSKTINKKLLELNQSFESKNSVIYYGIEHDNSREFPERSETLHFAYTGRIEQYQKRITDFVSYIFELEKRNIDFTFHFIGEGGELPLLKKELKRFVEKRKVIFYGRLIRPELMKILSKCHCIVLASEFEGLPLSLIEAMSLYCVPLVTNIESGIGEILVNNKNCLLHEIGDAEQFAQNAEILYKDRALFERLAQNSFETIENYNLNNQAMIDSYDRVISKIFEEIKSGYSRPEALAFKSKYGNIIPHNMTI